MIVVGVTGSLASGKSAAAVVFKRLGAKVFDADLAVRQITRKGQPVYRAVVKEFGRDFLRKNKELDRKKLAERVFSYPRDLKKLNSLIHPRVIASCLDLIRKLKKKKGVLVLDVPLLFETRMDRFTDATVVVSAAKKTIFARVRKKGISESLAKKILASQWSLSKKSRQADFRVNNNGSLGQLNEQICAIERKIQQSFPGCSGCGIRKHKGRS